MIRVFHKINDPKPVIASEAKQSQELRLLRFALYETLRERNDNWAFFWSTLIVETAIHRVSCLKRGTKRFSAASQKNSVYPKFKIW